jgi:prepilin-type N-terminal cleavage/methylation domain-containing protein
MRVPGLAARRSGRGFSLVELAVVMTIVAFLLGGLIYTLSAQTEQRNFEETRRRLEQARELLLGFAIVNGRLPCPARSAATAAPSTVAGDEVRTTGGVDPDCIGDAVTDYYGGVNAGVTLGLLPARTIGYQQVDASGLAVDAWGNRIRYAVAHLATNCSGALTYPHWTNSTNLKANGISCQPNDLLICKSSSFAGFSGTSCGGAANQIMSQSLVVAIVYSTGKNFSTAQDAATATAAGRTDEAANLNGDRIFVYHAPAGTDAATGGEFDDQFLWITTGEFYGRLIAAGVLP